MTKESIAVVGAGAWGTALALIAARAGNEVRLWAREDEVIDAINARHENPKFLPGVPLDAAITATDDFAELGTPEAVLLVVPTQHVGEVARALVRTLKVGTPIVICAKGIEQKSLKFPTEIVEAAAPGYPLAVLSGPSFAIDVARGLPTAITLACKDQALGARLIERIGLPGFRLYLSDDPVGAELGGAVKNVLAIACGIVDGKALGQSAKAALITRGFAEMARFGLAMGAKLETLTGLSGLGDLILTCSSTQSRNFSLGHAIGEGKHAADVLSNRITVTEGAFTAPALVALSEKHKVDMPITRGVDAIIRGRINTDEAIEALLARPMRSEGL